MVTSGGKRGRQCRRARAEERLLVVVAGPNGAGKSTFVETFLKQCQSNGYTVMLVFIGLESAELSLGRVIQRVERGGHDVPDEKIETRFPRTFDNLRQALIFVDEALLFDNSSSDHPFRFVAAFRHGKRQRRKGYAPAWAAFVR